MRIERQGGGAAIMVDELVDIARDAGRLIMEIYNSDLVVSSAGWLEFSRNALDAGLLTTADDGVPAPLILRLPFAHPRCLFLSSFVDGASKCLASRSRGTCTTWSVAHPALLTFYSEIVSAS